MNVTVAIISLYQNFTVANDIMFVNMTPFLISISLNLKFVAVERFKNIRVPTLIKAVCTIKKTYALQGFKLAVIKMYPEFEPIHDDVASFIILFNACAKKTISNHSL